MTTPPDLAKIVSLAKRRGFVFPSSEIYGGIGSSWDYGPLGVELKRNIKEAWWRSIVYERPDIVGLDSAIIQNPNVWIASGHAANFTDPLVECPQCRKRFRPDQLQNPQQCPDDNSPLSNPRMFNLMFKTFVGPLEDSANQVWLRPETAQGIFINFDNILKSSRLKLPFGIAQIGKSFRNEITPGNFIFRTREFEQMEMEFFVKPGDDDHWHNYWTHERFAWYANLGVQQHNLRIRPHQPDELAHYAKATSDIEYRFPWGWGELEGIANRTDYDLSQHQIASRKNLRYFDQQLNERYLPYVIEPAAGADRAALAFLFDAYHEEQAPASDGSQETRVVLRFHPNIAPIQIAVLPLSRNPALSPLAQQIHNQLLPHFRCQYDDAQSIGRRYRRQDEIGTPLCITIDFQTIEQDNAVTIRNRDTMTQTRIPIPDLPQAIPENLQTLTPTPEVR